MQLFYNIFKEIETIILRKNGLISYDEICVQDIKTNIFYARKIKCIYLCRYNIDDRILFNNKNEFFIYLKINIFKEKSNKEINNILTKNKKTLDIKSYIDYYNNYYINYFSKK